MIKTCEIIDRPHSGEFEEKIYDNQSPWNSNSWTYVKFTNSEYVDWCGVFRGQSRKIAKSDVKNEILVLTSDYLWRLSSGDGRLIEFENQPQYHSLSVAPIGDFVLADYYNIYRINTSLVKKNHIKSPIEMDMIKFIEWKFNKLIIECDEFANWQNHLILELDTRNWQIEVINATE